VWEVSSILNGTELFFAEYLSRIKEKWCGRLRADRFLRAKVRKSVVSIAIHAM